MDNNGSHVPNILLSGCLVSLVFPRKNVIQCMKYLSCISSHIYIYCVFSLFRSKTSTLGFLLSVAMKMCQWQRDWQSITAGYGRHCCGIFFIHPVGILNFRKTYNHFHASPSDRNPTVTEILLFIELVHHCKVNTERGYSQRKTLGFSPIWI